MILDKSIFVILSRQLIFVFSSNFRFICRYKHNSMARRHKEAEELLSSEMFSEYSRMTPEERRKKDLEWLKNIKRTKVKDFRDD